MNNSKTIRNINYRRKCSYIDKLITPDCCYKCEDKKKHNKVLDKDNYSRNASESGCKYYGHRGNRQWRKRLDIYKQHIKRHKFKKNLDKLDM